MGIKLVETEIQDREKFWFFSMQVFFYHRDELGS